MYHIVVARYSENIEWTKQFNHVLIYNKGEEISNEYNEIKLNNVGREGHTYYKYICDNYENLPEYAIFLQGNPFDHSPNIINNLNNIIKNPNLIQNFYYLSEWLIDCNLSGCNHHAGIPLMNTYEYLFGIRKTNMSFIFGAGAQFAVSKKIILQNPKIFYEKICNMLSYSVNPIEGFCIERFHPIIFNVHTDLILNRKLISDNERRNALFHFFNECSKKHKNENILYMPFNTNDRGNENPNVKEYSMCYNKTTPVLKLFCGPDCFFYNWPSANIESFEKTKQSIITKSNDIPTINKVGWYGNIYSPLSDVPEHSTRPLLYNMGKEHPDLLDIVHVSPVGHNINENVPQYLSLPDLTKYKYLIDIGGNGWSGRLKWLLFTKRPLLLVDRIYIEYFYNDLIPYVHYIPVNMNLSNLIEQVQWAINNPEKSNQIALNAFNYALENFTEEKFIERVYYVYNNLQNSS